MQGADNGRMPTLRVARGRTTAREFRFSGEIVIGRSEECGVRIFDEAASRRHAVVRREGDTYYAIDQRSLNGLYINGRRVEKHALKTGDEIMVRNLTLVFEDDGAAERRTAMVDTDDLSIESRVEPSRARVHGTEEELLGRLAAVYRFTGVLNRGPTKLRPALLKVLEETFAPCRAALILHDGNLGVYSRSVVDHVCSRREAILVREPEVELPGAASLVTERIKSAMGAPLGGFGALYVDRSSGIPFNPVDLELLTALANAATPVLRPPERIPDPSATEDEMLGESRAMKTLRDEIRRVAPTDATVLVVGETGTGKELVARALHARGRRKSGPFVAVNCAAFVETLLEAELFGHEKGAYTGADRARPGRFEQAHGGTLFLDEVGELAPSVQAKLLRVLETREFHRVGGTKATRVDVRIVAATNRDLRSGDFREDLYYRLGVVTLTCPPLRDREGDLRLLVSSFMGSRGFTDRALARLEAYPWPGNVRELRNVCERCSLMASSDLVDVDALPLEIQLGRAGSADAEPGRVMTLKEMEREMVARALAATGGNRTKAAKLLGITYPTIKKRIDEFGL